MVKGGEERILTLLQQARRQLEIERMQRREPIGIVGMACRFPGGASSPAKLWDLLVNRVDATGDVPLGRWDAEALYDPDPDASGKSYVRRAAFLDGIDGFDPAVFGISPREALGLDPQQRLLLELSWEALENAGIPIESLNGSPTGVWMGLCLDDYARRSITSGDFARIDAYSALGNLRSVAAGRIAYVLGLHGPAIQLDTACSSSLVALHLGCQSLRAGECDLALIGGVNIMLSAESTIALCRLKALAKDGRCKTFDAAADGYGRGEGGGVVVLQRLSDARAAGRRIVAVVRGTAVNHDGRSNGLTAPNGAAQEAVIRDAVAQAGVDPLQVGYAEVHGTGTPLGDPIEVLALSRVYGAGRSAASPLYLGSIKTNIGHLEGAAGVAGLIKTALCLSKRRLVPNLHLQHPNPRIPWSELPVRVVSEARDWPTTAGPRIAGVSSFGISGTNAHVLLEEAPGVELTASSPVRAAELVVLSAKSDPALRAQVANLAAHLVAHPDLDLADVAFSLMTTRSAFERRWSFSAASHSALVEALRVAGTGRIGESPALATNPKVVFVFPGQGSQWLGMGRQLLAEEPAFRDALAACDEAVRSEAGWSVIEQLTASEASSRLAHIDVVQPVLFSIQVALAALWRSWGVNPDAVVGHSMGEIAAACVSGALSLAAGAAVICRRSALLRQIRGRGAMALVELSMSEAEDAIAGLEHRVSVAVSNGQRSSVLSGDPDALALLLEKLEARGVFCRRVNVDVASHSPQVEPLLGDLVSSLEGLLLRSAELPMHSTVSGEWLRGPELTASYWASNLRQPVRFQQSVRRLMSEGFTSFVEISPHPLLVSAIEDIRRDVGASGTSVGSLRRDQPERSTLLESLGALYRAGHPLAAGRLFPQGARSVELPTYPWQRERYWLDPVSMAHRSGEAAVHPWLGARLPSPIADVVFESSLSLAAATWLSQHRVAGRAVLPGAVLAELVRMAGDEHRAGAACAVSDLVIRSPLVIPEVGQRFVQIVLTEGGSRAAVYSRPERDGARAAWILHATATLSLAREPGSPSVDLAELRASCPLPVEVTAVYAACRAMGLDYGPAFRGMRSLWRGKDQALAEVESSALPLDETFGLHPALLDAGLQTALGLLDVATLRGEVLLPFEIERYVVHELRARRLVVHAQLLEPASADGLLVQLTLVEPSGRVIARVDGLHLRRMNPSALAQTPPAAPSPSATPELFVLDWQEVTALPCSAALPGRWLVPSVAGDVLADAVVARLRDAGVDAQRANVSRLSAEHADHVLCYWEASGDADLAVQQAVDGLAVVQALSQKDRPPRLWWVTRSAADVVQGDPSNIGAATLLGLARTVAREKPELDCTLLDLDFRTLEPTATLVECLAGELAGGAEEREVAWRAGRRYVPRLTRAGEILEVPASENYRLQVAVGGSLDGLSLRPAERRAPSSGEVEIEVLGSGLNFRDVLGALGMYPGELGPLGSECAGIVTRLGRGVRELTAGELVMALTPGSFSRYVTLDARLAIRAPRGVSPVEAATIPVAFITAWYALNDLAALRAGETLLVHAAAGGVGMAAVQLAHQLGAEVVATASPSKWAVVHSLGIEHVASSRDVGFAEALRARGARVDVVLNSLSGEFIDASLALLSPGGRFVEMGKTDLRDPIDIAARHPGIIYRHFDLSQLGVERIADMFAAIVAGFNSGALRPLPLRTFAMTEARRAFRLMSRGGHVGKLALFPIRSAPEPHGSVLITGGLGALGAEAARALARGGTRHLVLMGRRGAATPGASDLVAELAALGAEATVVGGAVAGRDDVARALASVPVGRALRGVVHAAGFLDDGMLDAQTGQRFVDVMAPKVWGAWHLHTLTRELRLDFFVLFSSIAGTLGSPGQSGYAAANSFLDALAAHRRSLGICGSSLAWGPWAQKGLAAALETSLQARLTGQGFPPLSMVDGRALFERSLTRPESRLCPAAIDLRAVAKAHDGQIPPVWRGLIRRSSSTRMEDVDASLDLDALPAVDRRHAVLELVQSEVARVLSLSSTAAVHPDRPLKELGMDSLMAVELRNALGRRLALRLPATLVFHYPTAGAIAKHLSNQQDDALRPPTGADSEVAAHCECLQAVGAPRVRLFGFHDAGGSANLFAPFCRLSKSAIEIHAISNARRGKATETTAERYLEEAVAYIRGRSDVPCVLFGHSLGGLFAWRVLKALARAQAPLPRLLILSATVPPAAAERAQSPEGLGEIFEVVLGERAPAARGSRADFDADFALWGVMPKHSPEPLHVPIAAFVGRDDPVASGLAARAWADATRGEFSLSTFAGGHFYITEQEPRAAMLEKLEQMLTMIDSPLATPGAALRRGA
jgi:epothilone polyketide synthase D